MLHRTPLAQITQEQVPALVDGKIPENERLEYKKQPFHKDDKNKRLTSSSTSSRFANAGGGDIVFGIEEKDHLPEAMGGLEVDAVRRSVASRRWPRPTSRRACRACGTWPVRLDTGRFVLAMRVPRTLVGPHVVPLTTITTSTPATATGTIGARCPKPISALRSPPCVAWAWRYRQILTPQSGGWTGNAGRVNLAKYRRSSSPGYRPSCAVARPAIDWYL
jgi:hypothetical protein